MLSNDSALCIRWPKYWSFSFNISPSKDYSGLISFGIDWFDLLAVRGTLKSLLQHHSSKPSILRLSAFFIVQLSNPYMTTGKTIALTTWTFVGKVISLLFSMLSRFVLAWRIPGRRDLVAAIYGVTQSRTRLSNFTFTFHFHALEKAMATHSSVLAWRIPGTAEPGGLPSLGSHRVGHN